MPMLKDGLVHSLIVGQQVTMCGLPLDGVKIKAKLTCPQCVESHHRHFIDGWTSWNASHPDAAVKKDQD
jgi:hypothetical protein